MAGFFDNLSALDPSLMADQQGIDQQRMLAQALMQQGLTAPAGTESVGGVAIRRSPLEGIGRLAQILSGQNIQKSANSASQSLLQKQAAMLQGMFPGAGGSMAPPMQQAPMSTSSMFTPEQNAARAGQMQTPMTGATLAAATPPSTGGGLNIPGMDPKQAMFAYLQDKPAYMAQFLKQFEQTPEMKMAAAVFGQGTPQYKQALEAQVAKAGYIAPVNARAGSILRDPRTNQPIAFNPNIPEGQTPSFDASGNVIGTREIPGVLSGVARLAAAKTGGEGSQLPFSGVDASGQPLPVTNRTAAATQGQAPAFQTNDPAAFRAKLAKHPELLAEFDAQYPNAGKPAGGGIYSAPPLGAVANADAAGKDSQTELSTKWKSLTADNSSAQTVVSRLQNIRQLAHGAITGAETQRRDFFNGLLSLLPDGSTLAKQATDSKTASDLVDKNAAQISSALRMGQGGAGSDALQTLLQSANPNRHMTKEAINEAVDQLVASQRMTQAKANLLGPAANKRDPGAYSAAEVQFDQAADPRIWQLKSMSAEQAQKYLSTLPPDVSADLRTKAQALKQMGGAVMADGLDVLLSQPAQGNGLDVLLGAPVAPAAAASAPAAPQQPAAPAPTWRDEIARQLGLTARHAATGLTGIPAMVGNGLNTVLNVGISGANALGANIPKLDMPSAVIQRGLTSAGLPEPQNAGERLVGDATSAMAGVAPMFGLGKALSGFASDGAAGIGRLLTSVPGNQVLAAGAAGASGGGARELGYGPGAQIAASLLGGAAGSMGAATVGGLANKLKASAFPSEPNPAVVAPAIEEVTSGSPMQPSAARTGQMQKTAAILMKASPNADPQSVARAADFRSLGMNGTLGQITRDPALFAQEQNWRGIDGLGTPLLTKFRQQNQQLGAALKATAGDGGTEYAAGNEIMGALKSFDTSLKAKITKAYADARASTGAELDVPLQGVAQDYAKVMHDFGSAVPSGVQNNFKGLGLLDGTQKKVFSVEDAENLLKVINANRSNEPATNLALDQLSRSVKNAVLSADDQGGAFAAARKLAAERFDLHDKVPALNAAVYEKVAPDNFASRYIINGNVNDVGGMASILGPNALKALQGQIGNKLQQAAFGTNAAGDKVFAPERFGNALSKQLGPDLLSKVYTPAQLDDLNAIGRVGAYINAEPAFSAVNRSNTGSAVLDMAQHIPLVGRAVNSVGKKAFIARAVRGDLADTAVTPTNQGIAQMLLTNGIRQTQPVPMQQQSSP